MQSILQVYADLIKDGVKTIEQVPQKDRADVQKLLNANAAT
ncbi:CD1375 family protein [Brevibacillus sp. NPDC003359]